MNTTLRTKLSLSYIFITLLMIGLLSFLVNFLLEKQFNNYILRQQEARNEQIVKLLDQQYKNRSWDVKAVENIGINALEQGMIIKVNDPSGSIIWDATVHNQGLCQQMIDHMAQNMQSHYPDFKGRYTEKTYSLKQVENQIGTVSIGYYGPFYFNDNDLAFLNALNRMLFGVAFAALLIAFILGTVMAGRISGPILQTIGAARRIADGNYTDRMTANAGTVEINLLIDTINSLADTLDRQENLRKRLSADVAHELRTPLATLQSHLEAMLDGIWEADQARLKSCHEEVLRINKLVGDLEKLAKYEGEGLKLEKSEFDLSSLVQSILLNFEMEAYKKNIQMDLKAGQIQIYADRDKISQLLINLLDNAIKYTLTGGLIQIGIETDRENVKISVQDNGKGISPEDLPYVFERFYRADQSRTRLSGGSGIGLAIAKAIAEAHGGSIRVDSMLHEGTTFTVTLPVGLRPS